MNPTKVAPSTQYAPSSAGEVQELVRALPKVLPHGAQTKRPLLYAAADETVARLDMTKFSGIIEYEPGEYTFTAYAGTRLIDIASALAEHGQYMPFDPPLLEAGATLGGTIAAGLSGSGRYRYGGLRDFILGVQIVDGQGTLVRGGGKVVKNAAGFDLPKLLVGSMGRLGILISASFKVFPAPLATATLRATFPTLPDAFNVTARLMGGPYDLESLDLLPQTDGRAHLLVRIGGPAGVLPERLDRLRALCGNGEAIADDAALWREAREFAWVDDAHSLIKIATTPNSLAALDKALNAANAPRRYAVGGNLAWLAWPHSVESCHELLTSQGLRGIVLRGALPGDTPRALIGLPVHNTFLQRIQVALDPNARFLPIE